MAITQSVDLRSVWFGVLIAPAAWLIQFETNYLLVDWACSHGRNLAPLYTVSVLFLLIAAGSGLLSWHNWKSSESPHLRFFTMLGVLMSTLFALVIIAQMVPLIFFANPCIQ